jgi:hypothetical protein
LRRIDRLARRAHAFHRFAHHPLCDRYGGELVQLGARTRFCRGCSLTGVGGLLGVALGVSPFGIAAAVLVAGIAAAAGPKSRERLVPALAVAYAATMGVRFGGSLLALTALAASLMAAFVILYRRRGPDRSPCATCPERGAEICSGLTEIARRERAFRRLAGRWLQSPG